MEKATKLEDYIGQYFEVEKDAAGEGSFGSCQVIKHIKTGELAILKKSKPEAEVKKAELKYIKNEFNNLKVMFLSGKSPFENKYIVRPIGYYKSSRNEHCILMEYCEKGDLHDYIKRVKGLEYDDGTPARLKEKRIIHLFSQLLMGLADIQNNFIIHRDIKDKNIFITKSGSFMIGKRQLFTTHPST